MRLFLSMSLRKPCRELCTTVSQFTSIAQDAEYILCSYPSLQTAPAPWQLRQSDIPIAIVSVRVFARVGAANRAFDSMRLTPSFVSKSHQIHHYLPY